MAGFDVKTYCGHWYDQVKDFFKKNPDEVHKREDAVIWDFIEHKLGIPVDCELRSIDMPRIRRAIQDLRNYYYPRTASFFERQNIAKEYGGRYQETEKSGREKLRAMRQEVGM